MRVTEPRRKIRRLHCAKMTTPMMSTGQGTSAPNHITLRRRGNRLDTANPPLW